MNLYKFISPLFGVVLKNNDKIEKGKYIFISKDYLDEYLETFNKDVPNHMPLVRNCFKQDYEVKNRCYVEISCQARDHNEAKELIVLDYDRLANALRFMLGDNDEYYGLGVFDFRANISGELLCICSDGGIYTWSNTPIRIPIIPIVLDQGNYFFSNKFGYNKIWDILNSTSSNEIEKRIIKAIEWIGMAINERQSSTAFIQCMFAIECLLQDQKGFISKSISAQIGEYVAFIVGSDMKSRCEVEKQFKELYEIRSKIAHGENIRKIGSALVNLLGCLDK